MEAAPNYYRRVQGSAAAPGQAIRELETAPEGCSRQSKRLYLIQAQGSPIGCLAMLHGYPAKHVAYIAVLLFIESHQGRGLGRQATKFSANIGREWRCSALRRGVLEDDPRGLAGS